MKTDTKNLVSITDANQNFSQVVKKVESVGEVIILKNNKPQYVVSKIDTKNKFSENDMLFIIAKLILTEHKYAFEVLGQW